jgi:alkylation response protein AidB-like acyl-CoA dehydrogenase
MDQDIQSSNGKEDVKESATNNAGRYLLGEWIKSQPNNFYAYDKYFQRSLEFLWGRDVYQSNASRLNRFGALVAQEIDPLVSEMSQHPGLPKLASFDLIGNRVEEINFHPNHHEIGRRIYSSGMMGVYKESGSNLLSLSLFFLSSQLGEAGHNCALACTAGMIKALKSKGSAGLKDKYLPALLDDSYGDHLSGAQFLTEIQGGSDVGANSTTARLLSLEEDVWLLKGEKWFCSNLTADLALVTARVPGQGKGTFGLGLFLMPRKLADGKLNNVFIQKLKDKLGTRALATGEIELRDAIAYQVGELEDGFRNTMVYVINTSRIHNSVAACGGARRAYQIASSYATYRHAFGRQIIQFPLVQDVLANMRADYMASLSGTLHLVNLQDEIELDQAGGQASEFSRLAINLNKFRTAELAHDVIMKAIEILGGNGTIETFSILPRLLRDNIIYEKWEGTKNVLLAQALRDIRRFRYDLPFFAVVKTQFASVSEDELRQAGSDQAAQLESEIDEILSMDELTAAIYFNSWASRLIDLYYASCLASEGQWELLEKQDKTKIRLASLFFYRRVLALEPKDIAYYDDKVSRLCT